MSAAIGTSPLAREQGIGTSPPAREQGIATQADAATAAFRVHRAPPLDPPFDDELGPDVYRPPQPAPESTQYCADEPPSPGCQSAASRFLKVCLELFNGYRPVAQMRLLLHNEHALDLVDELVKTKAQLDQMRLRHGGEERLRCTGMRVGEPRRGVAEAAAVLSDGLRTWAMCYRLESDGTTWRCTYLRAALPSTRTLIATARMAAQTKATNRSPARQPAKPHQPAPTAHTTSASPPSRAGHATHSPAPPTPAARTTPSPTTHTAPAARTTPSPTTRTTPAARTTPSQTPPVAPASTASARRPRASTPATSSASSHASNPPLPPAPLASSDSAPAATTRRPRSSQEAIHAARSADPPQTAASLGAQGIGPALDGSKDTASLPSPVPSATQPVKPRPTRGRKSSAPATDRRAPAPDAGKAPASATGKAPALDADKRAPTSATDKLTPDADKRAPASAIGRRAPAPDAGKRAPASDDGKAPAPDAGELVLPANRKARSGRKSPSAQPEASGRTGCEEHGRRSQSDTPASADGI